MSPFSDSKRSLLLENTWVSWRAAAKKGKTMREQTSGMEAGSKLKET